MVIASYEPTPGESITHACREAINIANRQRSIVAFKFNDIEMFARPSDHETDLEGLYHHMCEQRAEAYRKSPEGIAAREKSEREGRQGQAQIDALVSGMNPVFDAGLDATITWLERYATLADDIRIDSHRDAVMSALLAHGYVNNEFTGADWVPGDKRVMGRWIVGQCINCMSIGMPPHPVSIKFCREYADMRG